MADYWDTYMMACDTEDPITKIKLLMECLGQTEEESVRRKAAHDLGDIFYTGKGVPVDKERGKKLMKLAADWDLPEAINLYGQMLANDGDTDCITYFCLALDKAQILAAINLNKLLIAGQNAGNTGMCNVIEAGVAEVARINREDKTDKGEAYLALALIGLYGLGQKCGISVAQGEEYLRKAAEAGHPYAQIISEDPSLKYPEAQPEQAVNNVAYTPEKPAKETNTYVEPVKTSGSSTAEPDKTTDSSRTKTDPFGITDIIVSLVVGAIGGLVINWIFQTGFLIPFLIVSVIFCGIMFFGSDC